jgi:hypothetical protein
MRSQAPPGNEGVFRKRLGWMRVLSTKLWANWSKRCDSFSSKILPSGPNASQACPMPICSGITQACTQRIITRKSLRALLLDCPPKTLIKPATFPLSSSKLIKSRAFFRTPLTPPWYSVEPLPALEMRGFWLR